MTDGHDAHYEQASYEDSEPWSHELEMRPRPPASPPRPVSWQISGEDVEQHA